MVYHVSGEESFITRKYSKLQEWLHNVPCLITTRITIQAILMTIVIVKYLSLTQ